MGVLLRNRPPSVGLLLGVLRAGAAWSPQPRAGPGAGHAPTSRRSISAVLAGDPDDLTGLAPSRRARATTVPGLRARRTLRRQRRRRRAPERAACARRRRADAHQRHHRAAQAGRPQLRDARAGARRGQALRASRDEPSGCAAGWRSSTRRWCTSAGCSGCCSACIDGRSFCLLERFTVEGWVDAVRRHRPARPAWCPRRCAWCSTPTSTPTI